MIRTALTAIALTLTLSACSDSHDVTTTDIDVNVNTSSHTSSPVGSMIWVECDDFVTNMLLMHGVPSYTTEHEEHRENFDLLAETSYFYIESELRFVVSFYRDGSCETFDSFFLA